MRSKYMLPFLQFGDISVFVKLYFEVQFSHESTQIEQQVILVADIVTCHCSKASVMTLEIVLFKGPVSQHA